MGRRKRKWKKNSRTWVFGWCFLFVDTCPWNKFTDRNIYLFNRFCSRTLFISSINQRVFDQNLLNKLNESTTIVWGLLGKAFVVLKLSQAHQKRCCWHNSATFKKCWIDHIIHQHKPISNRSLLFVVCTQSVGWFWIPFVAKLFGKSSYITQYSAV